MEIRLVLLVVSSKIAKTQMKTSLAEVKINKKDFVQFSETICSSSSLLCVQTAARLWVRSSPWRSWRRQETRTAPGSRILQDNLLRSAPLCEDGVMMCDVYSRQLLLSLGRAVCLCWVWVSSCWQTITDLLLLTTFVLSCRLLGSCVNAKCKSRA